MRINLRNWSEKKQSSKFKMSFDFNQRHLIFGIFIWLMAVSTFAFSYFFAPYHHGGDQEHYIKAYEAMASLSFFNAFDEYPKIIHTAEPVHFLIIWTLSSFGLDKNIVMAFANSILVILFIKFLKKKGASLLMIVWITFSSYYLLTMFFTLERTKFAFIFILFYFLTKNFWWLAIASITHSLTLIPIVTTIAGKILFIRNNKISKSSYKTKFVFLSKIIVIIFFTFLIYDFLGTHLYNKFFTYYYENLIHQNFFDGLPLIMLCIITLITSANKRIVILFFMVLLILTILISGSRINMIGYFGFLYFSNIKHHTFKFSILLIGCYLFYKSLIYLNNIYYFGG